MNTRQHVFDTLIAAAVLVVLFFVVNPFGIWMPSQVEMILAGVFAALFVVFSALIWRERPQDEREEAHAAFAGRVAFFAGTTTIAIGIVYQSIQHTLDMWLAAVLFVMLISKSIARIYTRSRR